MKKSHIVIVLSLLLAATTFAQDIDQMPSVSVVGSAELLVAPDEVFFSLDFTKVNKDLNTARRLNDEGVAKVLELTRRFGILPQDVKTDNISVQMKYREIRDPKKKVFDEDGDEVGTRLFTGYEVSKTVKVKLAEISRFEEFFGEILKTGVTEVNSVSFQTSKLRDSRDTARDMAMKAAREKASALAASIGQTIGNALVISEEGAATVSSISGSNGSANSYVVDGASLFKETLASFAPGGIEVTARVKVAFLLK